MDCRRALDKQVAYGMIHRSPEGGLSTTERGLAFLVEIWQVHAEVTAEERLAVLADLAALPG